MTLLKDVTTGGERMVVRVTAVGPAVPALREAARSYAVRHGVERPDDVALAITEACTNAVVHAYKGRYPGPMILSCACEDGMASFAVRDEGECLLPRTDRSGLGLGLPIIAQLADDFQIRRAGASGTCVQMRFAIAEQGGEP